MWTKALFDPTHFEIIYIYIFIYYFKVFQNGRQSQWRIEVERHNEDKENTYGTSVFVTHRTRSIISASTKGTDLFLFFSQIEGVCLLVPVKTTTRRTQIRTVREEADG